MTAEEKEIFDQGWWSCFSSMSNEIVGISRSESSMIILATLTSAGITKEELEGAIKTEYFDSRVLDILKNYKG